MRVPTPALRQKRFGVLVEGVGEQALRSTFRALDEEICRPRPHAGVHCAQESITLWALPTIRRVHKLEPRKVVDVACGASDYEPSGYRRGRFPWGLRAI